MSSAPFNINIPCQVTIALDGTVAIQTVTPQDFALSVANASFEGYLRDDVLKAFVVSNNGVGADVRLGVELVTEDDGSNFATSIGHELGTAAKEATSDVNLEAYLIAWAKEKLTEELATNGVAAAVEAGGLEGLVLTSPATDFITGARKCIMASVLLHPKSVP